MSYHLTTRVKNGGEQNDNKPSTAPGHSGAFFCLKFASQEDAINSNVDINIARFSTTLVTSLQQYQESPLALCSSALPIIRLIIGISLEIQLITGKTGFLNWKLSCKLLILRWASPAQDWK
ncbi:hypothetical protein AB733_20280 [Photobacterium swingsii]|uniref:hypothetical protein n=1 Tax=Photobacterium swingsii TaxID=680026 RepID=UPI0006624CCD|nr:hypothetical protein [Photobacterium swingsii]KMV29000.1 hypothetical protein AB733_20280 [Photobacterium swingsii]